MINPDAIPRIDGDMDALTAHADSIETTGIAIAATGALVHQVGELASGYGQLTLGEAARRAVAGDKEAAKAMKMVKQAGRQKKGGK